MLRYEILGRMSSWRESLRNSLARKRSRPSQRTIRVECLEPRRLLAITVDTLVDELDGSIADGDISLRDAIAAAVSGEVINFSSSLSGVIQLSNLGSLEINKSLTIAGPGADRLTIRAYDADLLASGNGERVFFVQDGNDATHATVSISGLTLVGGDATGNGGAIQNHEDLTITKCRITGNTSAGHGGALSTETGKLVVIDSTVSGNTANDYATYGGGGGIAAFGYLSVVRSAIFDNAAASHGGGIFSQDGNLKIVNSTISGNRAGATEEQRLYRRRRVVPGQ